MCDNFCSSALDFVKYLNCLRSTPNPSLNMQLHQYMELLTAHFRFPYHLDYLFVFVCSYVFAPATYTIILVSLYYAFSPDLNRILYVINQRMVELSLLYLYAVTVVLSNSSLASAPRQIAI